MDEWYDNNGLWLPSYQWMTAIRLLEEYGLVLTSADVSLLLMKKSSFYFDFLTVSMGHVLNGIILEQAKEYRLFVEKLFVDYFMSGESDKEEGVGNDTRLALEEQRKAVVTMGAQFESLWKEHERSVNETTRQTKALTEKYLNFLQTQPISMHYFHTLFVDADGVEIQPDAWERLKKNLPEPLTAEAEAFIKTSLQAISTFADELHELKETRLHTAQLHRKQFNEYRIAYYEKIGIVQSLLFQLPRFHLDEHLDAQNRERLNFDAKIGLDGRSS